MGRIARILPETGVFHIMVRGNNRQEIFREEQDYRHYLLLLKLYKYDHHFKLYHYCLMSNHVHLMLETTLKTNLPKFMKQINLTYMHYFRKKYKYWGHFWQGRYKSSLIAMDEYLNVCGKYIELNPVRARMVERPEQYMWSSYKAYAGESRDDLVTLNPLYEHLGHTKEERETNYKKLICDEIDLEKRYIGSESFVKQMEALFGVLNTWKGVGRPRKCRN